MTKTTETAFHALWAKKNDRHGQFEWLPLPVHLQDTMDMAGWLWDHWMSGGPKELVVSQMQNGNEELAGRLVRFLGGIHDLGKATPAFQTQKGYSSSEDLDRCLLEKLEYAGFTGISDLQLASARDTRHALAGEVILHGSGVGGDIASIVGAHHGKPVDRVEQCDAQSAYTANYYQSENASSAAAQLWRNVQQEVLSWALEESELYEIQALPALAVPAQVILSGLLIMADWITSNESYFPLYPLEAEETRCAGKRFEEGVRAWRRSSPPAPKEPVSVRKLYRQRFSFEHPRDFQEVIFQTVREIREPGLVIIEAPTGCGKTEAALATAEQLAAKTGRSGLFFGLPTQATSNGIFPRIYDWLKSIPGEKEQASLRLVHGKAALNPLMERLALASHIAEDDEDAGAGGTVITNAWFSGRKTASLDDFVVGTVDHFLLTALKQKHLALRHLGFSGKVVIIDEVHAYDAYMQQYLQEAIRWMGAYRVPVILLSATLPAEKREEFVIAYLKGTGLKRREIEVQEAAIRGEQYPLVTCTDGSCVRLNGEFPRQQDRKVAVKRLEEQELYDTIGDLIREGGVLGIIVNTVRRAQEIAARCAERFGGETVELLHSGFIATDRVRREEQLLRMIGKRAERPARKIIIGTQVIEQSLDIDLDVLITDLCPVDLLLQRIGRLHRHDGVCRPEGHREPVLYLLGMSDTFDFEQGSEAVYGAYLLMRTQCFLPQLIHIPSDVSPLVQKVYGQSKPVLSGALTEKYRRAAEISDADRERAENKAQAFRIDPPSLKIRPERNNLIGWLRNPDASETEESACAQVRDIRETVEVIAVRAADGGGYGFFCPECAQDVDVSGSLDDPEVARRLAGQTLRIPYSAVLRAGGGGRLIRALENYNREHLWSWQSSPWLKGTLGIVFDSSNMFCIGGCTLRYDVKYGLSVERGESSG